MGNSNRFRMKPGMRVPHDRRSEAMAIVGVALLATTFSIRAKPHDRLGYASSIMGHPLR